MILRSAESGAKKLLLMIVGVVLAGGFAVWNIQHALSTPGVKAKLAKVQETVEKGMGAAQQIQGLTKSMSDKEVPKVPESDLAPRSDPFAELGSQEAKASDERDSVEKLAPGLASKAKPIPDANADPLAIYERAPGAKVAAAPGPLPPAGPVTIQAPAAAPPKPAAPTPTPERPELVGTLLGDEPSALFRKGSQVVMVPQGDSLDGWDVLEITHGRVRIRRHGEKQAITLLPRPRESSEKAAAPAH